MESKRFSLIDKVFVIILACVLALGVFIQTGSSFSGTEGTFGVDTTGEKYIEVDDINISRNVYWNSLNRTDTLAYPEQAASYIIFKDGSNYKARNGETGQIDYSNSDAQNIINSVYNAIEIYGTIYVKGNITINSSFLILKSINFIHDGFAILNSDWIIIGDASNFVKGFYIKLNEVDGQDKTSIAITLRHGTAGSIYFNKIKRCDVGIYFDPVGIGTGENSFYGGWITAGNIGIDFNTTGLNIWCQGNRFYMSIYAMTNYGLRITGTTASSMQLFIGTIDCAIGVDPDHPAEGGGDDIYDTKGQHVFLIVFSRPDKTTLGIGTFMTNYWAHYLSLYTIKRNFNVQIGLNDAYGSATSQKDIVQVPRKLNITWGGTFDPGENVTIAIQNPKNVTYTVFKSAQATGSVALTLDELYGFAMDKISITQLDFWAKTDQVATTVTVSIDLWG